MDVFSGIGHVSSSAEEINMKKMFVEQVLENKMRHQTCYPIPFNRAKRYQSFVHYALSRYQFK